MALGDPYIDEAELADFLKMTVSGNEAELDLAARASTQWIEGYCRRQFNLADAATPRTFDAYRSGVVWVDDIGDTTDLVVATDSNQDGSYATTWADADYQLDPTDAIGQGQPVQSIRAVGSYCFPGVFRRTGLVRVTAKWGWPALPGDVHLACLLQAARLYKRRESAEGVLGFGEFGPVRVGSRVDPDVEMLLANYRLAAVA